MSWKMGKLKNFVTQIMKAKFEKKNPSFPVTLRISDLEIILYVREEEKVKNIVTK